MREMLSGFPAHDWQFWVATCAMALAAGWLLRNVLPVPFLSKRAKKQKQTRKVGLTIGGEAVGGGKAKGRGDRH